MDRQVCRSLGMGGTLAIMVAAWLLAAPASAWVVDFENVDGNAGQTDHGYVLNREQLGLGAGPYSAQIPGASPGLGMTIKAGASNKSPYVVAFDSAETGTLDPDLQDPFDHLKVYDYNSNDGTFWSATQLAGTESSLYRPGTILIAQNKDYQADCASGRCDDPNDQHPGPSVVEFSFTSAVTLTSIDVFDIEDTATTREAALTTGQAAVFDFYDGVGTLFASLVAPDTGDGGAARLVFNGGAGFANVARLEVTFRGSGAVDGIDGEGTPTVPEPATMLLLGLGLGGVGLASRRRRAR